MMETSIRTEPRYVNSFINPGLCGKVFSKGLLGDGW